MYAYSMHRIFAVSITSNTSQVKSSSFPRHFIKLESSITYIEFSLLPYKKISHQKLTKILKSNQTKRTTMTTDNPKIKLTYFDIEGVAEGVRLAFILGGTEFEDDRIQFSQWGELKSKTPHGTLPVMTIDNGDGSPPTGMLTQSGAMIRYAAALDKSGSLHPPCKIYYIEQAIGIIGDLTGAWKPSLYISMRPSTYGYADDFPKTDEGMALIKKMRTEFIAVELPKYLKFLSDLIEANGGTWLCGGDKPTIADCLAIPTIRYFTKGLIDHVDDDCVNTNPDIVKYVERFCSLPEIKGRYTTGLGSAI